MIGSLGWLFVLSTLVLGWKLFRSQNREAELLTINKALRSRIAALQKEIRDRDAARMLRFRRKAGNP